jgi:glycosyltransferase involved in cell wall biosynthesis
MQTRLNKTDVSAPDFVSVIIPTYNRARCLGRAIRSVLSQTHANLELIIADDASTDDTASLVAAIDDPRIVFARQERNQGASAARNLGLSMARGPLIAFQDSDDEWLLDKLEGQIAALEEAGPQFGATFGEKLIYGLDEQHRYGPGRISIVPPANRPVVSGVLTGQLLQGNLISPQTLLVRADVARQVGGFDTMLPCNNDWEYMLRLSTTTQILFTPTPVVVAYIQDDSIHRKMRSKARSSLTILRKHADLFEQDPSAFADRLYTAGRYFHRLGRYRAAALCLRRSIALSPWKPKPWVALAWARLAGVVKA